LVERGAVQIEMARQASDWPKALHVQGMREAVPVDPVEARRKEWLEEAIRLLGEATALSPDRAEAHYQTARARIVEGDREEALSSLERALIADPEFAPARVAAERVRKASRAAGEEPLVVPRSEGAPQDP